MRYMTKALPESKGEKIFWKRKKTIIINEEITFSSEIYNANLFFMDSHKTVLKIMLKVLTTDD